MPPPKRIVLFVEGHGDIQASPALVSNILGELDSWEHAFVDKDCFRVGNLGFLMKEDGKNWLRLLGAAAKRPNLGGVLLLLDGDCSSINEEPFCAAMHACRLARLSQSVGGGTFFSVACIFARQEFESWIIACATEIAGQSRSDGLPGLAADSKTPDGQLEEHPRDAKGWLGDRMSNGYSETQDQAALTRLMVAHKPIVRERMRSFRRLENAVAQVVNAIRSDKPMVSPPTFPGLE